MFVTNEKTLLNNDVEKLFFDNLYLVQIIINKFYLYYREKDDIRQAGLLGLFQASQNYNKDKNVLFSTYATYYIIGEIKKEIKRNNLIKVGAKVNQVIKLLKAGKTPKEILDQGYLALEVYEALAYKDGVTLLEKEVEYEDGKILDEIAYYLKGKYYLVIRYRYFDGLSQKHIGKLLNLSQSEVSRIEKSAITILKRVYRS